MPVDVTEKYIRIRQREPGEFEPDSMRTVELSEEQGISCVMGKLRGQDTMTIQTYLFDKEKWTVAEAEAWVKEHKKARAIKRGARHSADDLRMLREIKQHAYTIHGHASALGADDDDEQPPPAKADGLPGAAAVLAPTSNRVKALDDWQLDVLGCPYGGPDNGRDAQGEYFAADTDFHDDRYGLPPVVYYHGFTPDGKPAGAPEYIGKTVSREKRSDGVWYRVVLDKTSALARRVWEAAKQGIARASSGSIAHLVRVESDGHIRHWPVAELSLLDATDGRRPANGYAVALPVLKSIYQQAGIDLPDDIAEPQAASIGEPGKLTDAAAEAHTQSIQTNPIGGSEMEESQIKSLVQTAIAEALQAEKTQADAEAKRKAEFDEAVKKAVDEQIAAVGRLPDGMPYVTQFPFTAKYDGIEPGNHAFLLAVLESGRRAGVLQRDYDREASLKALALKCFSKEQLGKNAIQQAIKAMPDEMRAKANEINRSTLSGYGDQWAGVLYSTQMWEKIRQDTPVVGNLPSIEVPQGSESITIPIESTDPTFYVVAQAASLPTTETTGWPNATITSSRVGTSNGSLTVAKMGARIMWTGEMEEDSVIPWVNNMRAQLEKAAAEQMEHAVIDGDTETGASTNINDIAGTPASTDLHMLLNGFRKLALVTNTANKRAGGALTVEDFLETAKLMGAAGAGAADPTKSAFIVDPWVHWKLLEQPELKTQDSYSAPTIENGVLQRLWGHPVMVSYFMNYAGVLLGTVTTDAYKNKSNNAGKVDQDTEANNTYGSILAVRWDQWLLGWKRRMTLETTRIARADTTEICCMLRWGLLYRDTEASAITYGLSV
jgi:hypothetical protein